MKPITEKAFEMRVRRVLADEGLKLRRCSTRSRWHSELGHHWLYNARGCRVEQTHVDLQELSRDLGVRVRADDEVVV